MRCTSVTILFFPLFLFLFLEDVGLFFDASCPPPFSLPVFEPAPSFLCVARPRGLDFWPSVKGCLLILSNLAVQTISMISRRRATTCVTKSDFNSPSAPNVNTEVAYALLDAYNRTKEVEVIRCLRPEVVPGILKRRLDLTSQT